LYSPFHNFGDKVLFPGGARDFFFYIAFRPAQSTVALPALPHTSSWHDLPLVLNVNITILNPIKSMIKK
jgi:hypothetical protein